MSPHAIPVHISIPDAECHAPLLEMREYNQYHDAFLQIAPSTRTACWAVSYETGGMPIEVWNGLVHRIPCSPLLSNIQLAALNTVLGSLVACVCDGASVEWNGNEWIGVLDDGAQCAFDTIDQILSGADGEVAGAVHASDWIRPDLTFRTDQLADSHDGITTIDDEEVVRVDFPGVLTITSETTDCEIEVAAQAIERDAWEEDRVVVVGTRTCLHEWHDECVT